MQYIAMNNEQIKAAIKAKGYTLKAFADVLGIAYGTLLNILAGRKPLTEQLRRHIMLALQTPQNAPGVPGASGGGISLPDEVWQGIDAAANAQGISSDKLARKLCKDIAENVAEQIICGRGIGK